MHFPLFNCLKSHDWNIEDYWLAFLHVRFIFIILKNINLIKIGTKYMTIYYFFIIYNVLLVSVDSQASPILPIAPEICYDKTYTYCYMTPATPSL